MTNDNTTHSADMVPWDSLDSERQLELREAFGHYLDSLPPTCSMDTKVERFTRWLAEQGVCYAGQETDGA